MVVRFERLQWVASGYSWLIRADAERLHTSCGPTDPEGLHGIVGATLKIRHTLAVATAHGAIGLRQEEGISHGQRTVRLNASKAPVLDGSRPRELIAETAKVVANRSGDGILVDKSVRYC